MKKLLFAFIAFIFIACGGNSSKDKTGTSTGGSDPALERRLAEYMKINEELDFEKLMNYIYPKLFDFASREQMVEALEEFFKSEEMKVKLEAVSIDKVHPVFKEGDGSYAKIDYSLVVLMDLSSEDDTDEEKAEQNDLIIKSMSEKYGKGNISIDEKTGMIRLAMASPMVAVKDEYAKEWSFVSFKDDPLINKLFGKEVLDKLASYK